LRARKPIRHDPTGPKTGGTILDSTACLQKTQVQTSLVLLGYVSS
jgi:hypothetical protein